MRLLSVVLCAAGCTFSAPDGEPGPDSGVAPTQDPPTSTPRSICDREDEALRLCVDFRAPFADRSSRGAALDAIAVSEMKRGDEPAAQLTAASTMHVGESPALDIDDRLTLDMWIQPTGVPVAPSKYWMLDNNTQYAASFTDQRKVRCVIGNQTVDSDPLADDGEFHHIACVYDRTAGKLKVYIDGSVSRCSDETLAIPRTGLAGLAIGANLSGTDAAPAYYEPFVGGIDDVRVWARSDLDICAIARGVNCKTACP
jgi:hypothetical protein